MSPILPADIAAHYRPLTDNEVRAASYGLLSEARFNFASDWRNQRGTFDDQAIFGPKRDFHCACGKYVGQEHQGVICDQCGVKLTASNVRQTRCAHANLAVAIPHALGTRNEQLRVMPVLPMSYVEAPQGAELLRAYDEVLRAREAGLTASAFERLLRMLAPLLISAHNWDLPQRRLVAHGMGLREVGT